MACGAWPELGSVNESARAVCKHGARCARGLRRTYLPSWQREPPQFGVLWAGGAPISIYPVLSNLQRRYILGRIQSDLRSPSSISNLQRRHLRPDSVRSPISISNWGAQTFKEMRYGFIHNAKGSPPSFRAIFAISSRPTRSLGTRRLWREVRISTSVARSQATARTNSRSQTPLEHLHRRRFASTSSSIYCCSWQEICHL